LVPLVEFSFVSPRGEKTVATMNPGLSYVAVSWQVAAEAIVPLNSEAGRSIGARAQLLLFLDELIPSLFGKPLLSRSFHWNSLCLCLGVSFCNFSSVAAPWRCASPGIEQPCGRNRKRRILATRKKRPLAP